MISFNNLNELIDYIDEDKRSAKWSNKRYPVRFILLPSLWKVKTIAEDLNWAEKIELSRFLPHNDAIFTSDNIREIVSALDSKKDYILLSFTEILRFYSESDFKVLITTLLEIENSDKMNRRIYVPVCGLHERFEKFFNLYPRRLEWDPIWKLEGNIEKIRLFIIKTPFYRRIINGTKELLELWKREELDNVFCCSNTLYNLSRSAISDQTFEIERIESEKDFLRLKGLDVPIPYKEEDSKFWRKILDIWEREKGVVDFHSLVETSLNIREIKREDLIDIWMKEDEFNRWLLKWYISIRDDWQDSYIAYVTKNLDTLNDEELIENLWFKIFEVIDKPEEEWFSERREYLKSIYKGKKIPPFIEEKLEEYLERVSDICKKLQFITGLSFTERKFIVKSFGESLGKDDKSSLLQLEDLLRETYPELYYYLKDIYPDNINEENKWIVDYIKYYKCSRVTDSINPKLIALLKEKNKDEKTFFSWYLSIQSLQNYIVKEEVDQIILIDALGLEWLSLVVGILEKKGFNIERKYVARVELPSITEVNRVDGSQYVRNLDEFIHSQSNYEYPENLIREIEIIKEIIEERLGSSKKILIIGDHGFTAFALSRFNNKKKYDFQQAEHEGRYMLIKNEMLKDDDFILYESMIGLNKKSYIVALKYTSLSDVPRREVHGGATPEEVLVPVIYASKMTPKEVSYKVELLTEEISVREPILEFKITPKVEDKLSVWYKRKKLDVSYDRDRDVYRIKLAGFKSGKYSFAIKIESWERTIEIEVKITGGMKENELI